MIGDYVSLSISNIRHRRKRSLLTVIGIFIGIAAITGLIAIGNGLQAAVEQQFESLGKDKITVLSSTGFASSPFASEVSANPLTNADVETVEKTRGVALAAGILMKTASAEVENENRIVVVLGYPLDEKRKLFEEFGGYEVVEGRKLRGTDGRKVVLGGYAADGLFKKKIRVGENVQVQGNQYGVVGIFKKTGDRFNDGTIFMPLETMRKDFDKKELVSMIFAQASAGEEPLQAAERVRERLAKQRGENDGQESFSVSTAEQLGEAFKSIFGIVQSVVLGLAAISLVVGAVGIMNTMYTSVLERTKEIGIMKAVGARNSDILTLFLIESGTLGMIGGLLGVSVGFALSKIVEILAQQALGTDLLKTSFPLELAAGAILFSFLVGAISGVLPALQAAKLKPVEALRYE